MLRCSFALGLVLFCGLSSASSQDEVLIDFKKAWPRFKERAERVEAVMTLEDATSAAVVDTLRKLFQDRDPEVARAAVRVLAKLRVAPIEARLLELLEKGKDPRLLACLCQAAGMARLHAAVPLLRERLQARDWLVRVRAIEALGLIGDKAAVAELIALLGDRTPAVRIAACDSLGTIGALDAGASVAALLGDKVWQVKAAAIAAVAKIRPKAAISPLIAMLRTEKGRLNDDVFRALVAITGNDFDRVETWERWWRSFGERYQVPSAAQLAALAAKKKESDARYHLPRKDSTTYHGIETPSKSILFIIDISGSMEDLVVDRERFKGRGYKSYEKMEIVKTELARTIAGLAPYVRFNILAFASAVKPWKKKLVRANVVNRSNAVRWVERLRPIGGASAAALATAMGGGDLSGGKTNTYGVLMQALDAAGHGLKDQHYQVAVDTIFFLSDGRPTTGEYVETDDIIARVCEANKMRKVVLHTIAIGQFQKGFMRDLATRNGGVFVDLGH